MSTLSLRLPHSLHEQIKKLAKQEGVSINQFISSAVSEKMAALMTVEYIKRRSKSGKRSKFDSVLKKIPNKPVPTEDKL